MVALTGLFEGGGGVDGSKRFRRQQNSSKTGNHLGYDVIILSYKLKPMKLYNGLRPIPIDMPIVIIIWFLIISAIPGCCCIYVFKVLNPENGICLSSEIRIQSMGNTMDVSHDVIGTIITAIKRVRPTDWVIDEPPSKRIRISSFEEDGAKAVKIPENHIVLPVN
jgi:hypothetical protein